jgi:hypothetical protein
MDVLVLGTQIGADDLLVAQDVRRWPGRDELAEVEHRRDLAAG